jgi:hypothetical protein
VAAGLSESVDPRVRRAGRLEKKMLLFFRLPGAAQGVTLAPTRSFGRKRYVVYYAQSAAVYAVQLAFGPVRGQNLEM